MSYYILLELGVNVEQRYNKLIKAGGNNNYTYPSTNVATALKGVSHFLRHVSKVTMYHKGEFHKCYIHFSPEIRFQFSVRRN